MPRPRLRPPIPFKAEAYRVTGNKLTEQILARELDWRLLLTSPHVATKIRAKQVDDLLQNPIGPHHNTPVGAFSCVDDSDTDTIHPLT